MIFACLMTKEIFQITGCYAGYGHHPCVGPQIKNLLMRPFVDTYSKMYKYNLICIVWYGDIIFNNKMYAGRTRDVRGTYAGRTRDVRGTYAGRTRDVRVFFPRARMRSSNSARLNKANVTTGNIV